MIQQIQENTQRQTRFFQSGQTIPVEFRIRQLKTLRSAILKYEGRLNEALWQDLHKSPFEAYATEIGMVLSEIRNHIRHLPSWAAPQKVFTNQMIHFWSSSRIYQEPYGHVLIFSPWNYPFMLLMTPLVGAISAGNCVTLKASEYAPATADVMDAMIREHFDPDYISFFKGGVETNQALLSEAYDYLFFTGSPAVGKVVMEAAARNLTPVTLELV